MPAFLVRRFRLSGNLALQVEKAVAQRMPLTQMFDYIQQNTTGGTKRPVVAGHFNGLDQRKTGGNGRAQLMIQLSAASEGSGRDHGGRAPGWIKRSRGRGWP